MTPAEHIAWLRERASDTYLNSIDLHALALCDAYEALAVERDDLRARLDVMGDVAWTHEHNCEWNRERYEALAAAARSLGWFCLRCNTTHYPAALRALLGEAS